MFEIPEPAVQHADRCPHGQACIDSARCLGHPKCSVKFRGAPHIVFLSTLKSSDCPYCVPAPLDYGYVCTCPARFAIYKKYGV